MPHLPDARPTEIHRLAERQMMRFVWSDQVEVDYPYTYLRGYCPCAGCQGHTPSQVKFHQPETDVEPWRIEPVGNYGISIQWSDGHATGIYRWDFLRTICPCPECVDDPQAAAANDLTGEEE